MRRIRYSATESLETQYLELSGECVHLLMFVIAPNADASYNY